MEIEGLYRQAMNSNTKHCHKTVQNHAYFFHIDYLYSVVRQYSRFIIQCISGSDFFFFKKEYTLHVPSTRSSSNRKRQGRKPCLLGRMLCADKGEFSCTHI